MMLKGSTILRGRGWGWGVLKLGYKQMDGKTDETKRFQCYIRYHTVSYHNIIRGYEHTDCEVRTLLGGSRLASCITLIIL